MLGYTISAMIQVFVPRSRLASKMGDADPTSISLASLFGMISSSCSFAALSAARALVKKGAHFICAIAFMFASTNLVIELGALILIFLGWQFLVAEIVGGLLLIVVSSILIYLTYPKAWLKDARDKVEAGDKDSTDDFDWKKRISSFEGWSKVGNKFVMEWQMVWQEILIGFTVAGIVAVFIPQTFWKTLFLAETAKAHPDSFLVALENAAIAPFVAAATFIGSMGNIPLATVLNSSGVLFAGIMGFIYSDLMVPPLVKINAKYYGWKVALYIAGIMYVSIVITSLTLHFIFLFTGMTPQSNQQVQDVATFSLDYTFFMNIAAIILVVGMYMLHRKLKQQQASKSEHEHQHDHQEHEMKHDDHEGHEHHNHDKNNWNIQTVVTWIFMVFLLFGCLAWALES